MAVQLNARRAYRATSALLLLAALVGAAAFDPRRTLQAGDTDSGEETGEVQPRSNDPPANQDQEAASPTDGESPNPNPGAQDAEDAADPSDAAAFDDSLRLAKKKPPPPTCNVAPTPHDFWTNGFKRIVSGTLGGFSPAECSGDPNRGGYPLNLQLALKTKAQLEAAAGCTNDFEVLVWAGTHGHDHQGANVLTARDSKLCDGGMYGIPPGSRCQGTGGTFHRFCTGVGKSYALFIQPAGAHTTFFDVEAAAQGCKQYVNLLIDFTRCLEHSGRSRGLRGVVVVPTVGIRAPKTGQLRKNEWALSEQCSTTGWLYCKSIVVSGRALTIFAVQPLA